MENKKIQKGLFFEYKKQSVLSSIVKRSDIILPLAFLILCAIGSILLILPFSTTNSISFLDALFTSVSAGCVTGLTVLSTGQDFTFFGQLIILLLIQAGGLGIMSITSILFIIFGKRMSLSQEKTTRDILDVESQDEIKNSLNLIFKYTFLIEFAGMCIFLICFLFSNMNISEALKNSIFLAVSAFCNAGFVLNQTGIIEYQSNPIILYTISCLVLFGAMSPAISVLIPKWLKGKKLSPQAVLVLNTTLIIIIIGTLFLIISENIGTMGTMSVWEKFNNAAFQAMATRTAGFSSINFSNINVGTYILMLIFMIIGGSPGGTAGGIKTCTFGVLVLTAYNLIKGKSNIIRNKNITFLTVQKAIALVFLYLLMLMVVVLTLITTQSIDADKLIFEAVSALGTVGVSMGITPQLDEVGRVIIIIAMFIGRVAPTTFLCYLNTKNYDTNISYPDARITLT